MVTLGTQPAHSRGPCAKKQILKTDLQFSLAQQRHLLCPNMLARMIFLLTGASNFDNRLTHLLDAAPSPRAYARRHRSCHAAAPLPHKRRPHPCPIALRPYRWRRSTTSMHRRPKHRIRHPVKRRRSITPRLPSPGANPGTLDTRRRDRSPPERGPGANSPGRTQPVAAKLPATFGLGVRVQHVRQ